MVMSSIFDSFSIALAQFDYFNTILIAVDEKNNLKSIQESTAVVFECLIFGYHELSFMLHITSKARQTHVQHMLSCSNILAVRQTYCIIKGSILSCKKRFSSNAKVISNSEFGSIFQTAYMKCFFQNTNKSNQEFCYII